MGAGEHGGFGHTSGSSGSSSTSILIATAELGLRFLESGLMVASPFWKRPLSIARMAFPTTFSSSRTATNGCTAST